MPKRIKLSDFNFFSKFFSLLFLLPCAVFITNSKILLAIIIIFFLSFIISFDVNIKKLWHVGRFYILLIFIGIFLLSLIFYNLPMAGRIVQSIMISSKFVLFTVLGFLFVLNTSPLEISTGLFQLGIPHSIGMTVVTSFRMLPLISQRIKNIIDAQKSRGLKLVLIPHKLLLFFLSLAVPIFYSTLEISLQISETLLSRGYDPNRKITLPPFKLEFPDYYLLLCSSVLLLLALLSKFQ